MQSVVLIIPAALQARANALGEAMGWGPGNFSVSLSGTHYGCHTWASDGFVAALEAKQLPPGLDFADVLDGLIWSARRIEPEGAFGHWQDILGQQGLTVDQPDE